MLLLKRICCFSLALLWMGGCAEIQVGTPTETACSADSDCVDGKECRVGTCSDGSCSYTILENWCFAQGSCFQPGQELPGDRCQSCDPTLIQSGLVNKKCAGDQICNSTTGQCKEPEPDVTEADQTEPDTSVKDTAVADTATDTGPVDTGKADTAKQEDTSTPVAPTCGEYCELFMASCAESPEFANATHCLNYCETFGKIPAGEVGAVSGNSLACRITELEKTKAEGFEGKLSDSCRAAGPSGGNVCGTWCENYCHLAIKNCSGEVTYFETFNDCKQACSEFPTDGEVASAQGDTVQCRIYHLGVAGDDLSGGAEIHCPHGSVSGTGACEPPDPSELCGVYCEAFQETCPLEKIGIKAYETQEDCLEACVGLDQDGKEGTSTGATIQCVNYHLSQAIDGQVALHCQNAAIGLGQICVTGPALRIVEVAPLHQNPFTGNLEGYIELMNQGETPISILDDEILIGTASISDNPETGTPELNNPIYTAIQGFEVIKPQERILILSNGAGNPGAPDGTIVIGAELAFKGASGFVVLQSMKEGSGFFDVVTYGGLGTEAIFSAYFEKKGWDYQGKPAEAANFEQTLSRCPEGTDTDDGSDFQNTDASPGAKNLCQDKGDEQPPKPGG
jgi:hypothetical protein